MLVLYKIYYYQINDTFHIIVTTFSFYFQLTGEALLRRGKKKKSYKSKESLQ